MTTPRPREPRVALVTNVLAHYRVPCFEELARLLPGRLTIFLLADDMAHRRYVLAQGPSDLPLVSLPGKRWRRSIDDDLHWNDLGPVLQGRFDVLILGGWAEPTYLLLWLRHLLRPTRMLFWIESTAVDRPRRGLREHLKRWMLSRAAGCVVPGQRAGSYCHSLGMPEERIFRAPNATDGATFRRRAARLQADRPGLRAELGLERPTFLFVGRLVEAFKGVSTLLEAFAQLQHGGIDAGLCLAGQGADEDRYRARVAELGLRHVHFLGTLDHESLSRYYAAVDALILPSRSEPWGFVLNEGMEFGLPLVVSDAVGAAPDLVGPGNGFTFPAGQTAPLAKALETLATKPELREAMGSVSRSRIVEYSPVNWARGMSQAIEASVERNSS